MKKLVSFIIVFILLLSCTNTGEKKPQTKLNETFYIDSISFDYKKENEVFARVLSSDFVTDTLILRNVLNDMGISEKIIYFHRTDLNKSGEEYAYLMGNNLTIAENYPKTKEEALFMHKITDIKNAISDIESIPLNDLNYDASIIYLDHIKTASNVYLRFENTADKKLMKENNILKQKLVSTQRQLFPKLRKFFAEDAKKKLWEDDIDVKYSGTTISFIGYQFAANKNIKESYEAISEHLHQLRFKQANFKWNEYSEYTFYKIESPADQEIK